MLKSFATDKKDYKPIQVRILHDNKLNIQGKGPEVNREYGAANVIQAGALADYLKTRRALVPSLADTEQVYVPAQAAIRGDSLHLQFEGRPFNRDYGAAFDIPVDVAPAIAALIGGKKESDEEEEAPTFTGCGS